MKIHAICRPAALLLTALFVALPSAADDVRLHGATTVIDRVITPHQAAVEQATGHKLVLAGNATGKGLVDLYEGRCDASLSSEPIEIALAAAQVAGKTVDRSKIQFHVLSHDTIVFVVHPSNPVGKLSWEQIRDIHTGKIKNWSEVGGRNEPITVFADTPTGGTRAMIKTVVMGGAEYKATTVSLTAVKKVADMVAADPTGFGGLGRGFVDQRCKIVDTKALERPLGFITLGSPSAAVQSVIDGFKKALAKP